MWQCSEFFRLGEREKKRRFKGSYFTAHVQNDEVWQGSAVSFQHVGGGQEISNARPATDMMTPL